jgi:uncharacterized protein YecE (DUF72 family)
MIRIGPAGWSYKDWRGVVYPNGRPRGFDELAYIAGFFDTVEINSSFYGAPRPSAAKKWLASVSPNERFRFTAKLFHSFTHERKPAPLDEKEFKDGILPLAEGNRLGALLAQFPWSFKNDGENRQYLVGLRRQFSDYPLVLEVRHSSWMEEGVLELLAELDVAICNIDQPLFKRSVRPSSLVTAAIGYVRLHGRNYKSWFSKTADVRERYDHLYSVDELEPWVARSKEIAEKADDTYVITNNHYLGKAVVNAVEISTILHGKPQPAPEELVKHYPELREFTDGPAQLGMS